MQTPEEFEDSSNSISCPICDEKIQIDKSTIKWASIYETAEGKLDTSVCLLKCLKCVKDVAVLHKDFWVPVDEFLHKPGVKDGLSKVKTESERVLLYVLNKVCHSQYDLDMNQVKDTKESLFRPHSKEELAHIMWVDGAAVGFYTVKEKGTPLYDGPYNYGVYQMPVVDTVYIRQRMRGCGLGACMIKHFLDQYCDQDVGFSAPMSIALLKVVYKMLFDESSLRDHIWECSSDGGEGYRRNVWFHTKRLFKTQPLSNISK